VRVSAEFDLISVTKCRKKMRCLWTAFVRRLSVKTFDHLRVHGRFNLFSRMCHFVLFPFVRVDSRV